MIMHIVNHRVNTVKENKRVMRERILAEGTPPPCFCVSAGIIGLTGERTVSAGIVGLSGEQELLKVESQKSKTRQELTQRSQRARSSQRKKRLKKRLKKRTGSPQRTRRTLRKKTRKSRDARAWDVRWIWEWWGYRGGGPWMQELRAQARRVEFAFSRAFHTPSSSTYAGPYSPAIPSYAPLPSIRNAPGGGVGRDN